MSSSSGTTSGTEATLDIAPKPPQPLYPDVPWWAVLIASIVFIFLGLIIGIYAGKFPSTGGLGGLSGLSLAMDTIAYLPHIILLFGVLADMFTLEGVWSIPSLVGLLSIFANALFKYFWKGIDALFDGAGQVWSKATGIGKGPGEGAGEGQSGKGRGKKGGGSFSNGYDGCAVQGFGSFNSPYAPQTLVVTASVFSYYCFDLIRNRGWINSIAAILGFLVLYIGEIVVIDLNVTEKGAAGCLVDGVPMGTPGQGIRAFFEGLLFGGVSYGIVQTYAPNRLPSSTISPFPRKSVGDLSPGPDGKMYDKDGYPFIVLPNGQAVPDVSDARSRAAFGALAGTATGQIMSLASNCPGQTATCPNAR